jgi:hypothetical protein
MATPLHMPLKYFLDFINFDFGIREALKKFGVKSSEFEKMSTVESMTSEIHFTREIHTRNSLHTQIYFAICKLWFPFLVIVNLWLFHSSKTICNKEYKLVWATKSFSSTSKNRGMDSLHSSSSNSSFSSSSFSSSCSSSYFSEFESIRTYKEKQNSGRMRHRQVYTLELGQVEVTNSWTEPQGGPTPQRGPTCQGGPSKSCRVMWSHSESQGVTRSHAESD